MHILLQLHFSAVLFQFPVIFGWTVYCTAVTVTWLCGIRYAEAETIFGEV